MLRIATGIFSILAFSVAVFIVMDASKISYAKMVDHRERSVHLERDAYTGEQLAKLNGYTWVDKQEGGVSIPVERAMQVIAAELGANTWAAVLPKPFSLDDLGITDESLMLAAGNAGAIERGAAIYAANCTGCHGAGGEGLSGPNLTDGYWLHGANPTEIYTTIHVGVGAKGMPAWGGALGAQVKDVVAYVLSLKDTNVAGKEAQGVDADGNAP
jgi:mono/diheme cytochrome c family protein